jgi:sulfite exporter TauE/SafE
MLGVLLLGFTLGLKHALESDHLAAIATISAGTSSLRRALKHGAMWGVGHTVTLIAVGGTILVLGRAIPKAASDVLEGIVGVVLIWLAIDVYRRVRRLHVHQHGHEDGTHHLHVHSHSPHQAHVPSAHLHPHPIIKPQRALLVGMVHGMAGSAALVVITAQAITSPLVGVLYMLVFGAGSIVAMSLVSLCIALPLQVSKQRVFRPEWLMLGAAAASLIVGVSILLSIGTSLGRSW